MLPWIRTLGALGCLILVAGCSQQNSSAAAPGPTVKRAVLTPAAPVKEGGNPIRRLVKIGSDPDSSKIDLTPKDATVEQIQGQKVPSELVSRQSPFETTAWRVKATLESVVHEKDGDYYLVLGGANGGKTVVEVPDPALCKDSRLIKQITNARKELEDRYHPTTVARALHDPATVTGIGFMGWGTSHKKKTATGYMGARLMPGIDFSFG